MDSVAEGGRPRRRVLQRAANLLTTKGELVPAVALHVETRPHPSPSSPSMPNGTHRRTHSHSVPDVSHSHASSSVSPSATAVPKLARARSDGAAFALGKSIRKTLKGVSGVSSYIVRSRSRSKSKDVSARNTSADANNTSAAAPPTARSISSQSAAPDIPNDTASLATGRPSRRGGSIKGHLRSASDVLWKKSHTFNLHPLTTSSSPYSAYENKSDTIVGSMVTSLPLVGSPDEMPSALDTAATSEDSAGTDDTAALPKRALSPIHEPPAPEPPVPDVSQEALAQPMSPQTPTAVADDVPIPPLLLNGVPMLKVSAKKQKRYFFRLDPDEGQILWQSKKLRISQYMLVRLLCVER